MINVVIVIPEITKGMKSIGSKSLLKKHGVSILEYQINQIKKINKNTVITILTGFDHDRILKTIESKYSNVAVVFNKDYYETNQMKSLEIYFKEAKQDINNLLIINNGILFNKLNPFPSTGDSSTIYLLDKPKNNFNIGCNSNSKHIDYLFYDLPKVWAECVYLNHDAINSMRSLMARTETKHLFIFEMINCLIKENIVFNRQYISARNIIKITGVQDLPKINNFI